MSLEIEHIKSEVCIIYLFIFLWNLKALFKRTPILMCLTINTIVYSPFWVYMQRSQFEQKIRIKCIVINQLNILSVLCLVYKFPYGSFSLFIFQFKYYWYLIKLDVLQQHAISVEKREEQVFCHFFLFFSVSFSSISIFFHIFYYDDGIRFSTKKKWKLSCKWVVHTEQW